MIPVAKYSESPVIQQTTESDNQQENSFNLDYSPRRTSRRVGTKYLYRERYNNLQRKYLLFSNLWDLFSS
jgi:hypothetical protein